MNSQKDSLSIRHSPDNFLTGLLPEEIYRVCALPQKFQGEQIFRWIASGVESFAEMTNLSLSERERLANSAVIRGSKLAVILKDPDGTIKLGIDLYDSQRVETVLLIDRAGRKTACVSCQVGCPMSCSFCQTGQLGFTRNLTAAEIVEQFLHLEKIAGKLDNIVFMGMGEPMLNLPAIRKAIAVLTHKKGRALSPRRITLSTSGICKGIYELGSLGPDIRLAVSLTTANTALRTKLMPITKQNSLEDLKKAIAFFNEKTKKRVTLELALMRGINTAPSFAREVIEFSKGLNVHINLIPWNPVESLDYASPTEKELIGFESLLRKAGIPVTLRHRRGKTICGACGQLGKKNNAKNSPS
ncbi:23S rRNA (adenine(2503)-C(2))-methyltransferase RlmN [Treponema phagedenis]|uniref:23S rRNA (adenine(2503)-C(2))-methyltransferase RlmN n=1 Tax=Treponema phagedenis TaxID=162 RepID=UPI0001F63978|nr:23S rRNA (adenine(2503)-C(2))-methyltransferase RlmN [Treponema phagedenis]EFW36414.1 23S rRNA m2A2503 methyltransferase [Treponema phagedenis F0421]TYT76642.1 23S rRNA (adenine(2503)-C(2))-methyltransferase RlmN [Treponema phagedenis]